MTLEQIKKLIITTKFAGLSQEDLIEKVEAMIKAEEDNPTIVPGITPTPAAVTTKVEDIKGYILDNAVLKLKQKENTGKIKALVKDVKNDITSKWANQVQNTPGMDKTKAALLGFGSKGLDDGQGEPAVKISNSNPTITIVDASRHLEHTLTIRNNVTGKIALPKDVKDTEVYMFIGKDEPVNFRKSCTYLGTAKRGKFTNTFTEDQVGSVVWYFVVYKARKAGVISTVADRVRTVVG
jgi:hypothetical protein